MMANRPADLATRYLSVVGNVAASAAGETLPRTDVDSPGRLEIEEVYDDGVLRITAIAGTSSRLVVSFSGIGSDPSKRPQEEFVATASKNGLHHVLFVMDSSRSWFNRPGAAEKVVQVVSVYQKMFAITETKTIGDSMGGFCAMVLPSLTEVSAVFATAPQFSVDPAVVPEETRWKAERAALSAVRFGTVQDFLQSGTLYVVGHGGAPREAVQRDRFPQAHNLWHFVCDDSGHSIAARMRRESLLQPVVDATFERKAQKVARLLSGPEWTKRSGGKFDAEVATTPLVLSAGE